MNQLEGIVPHLPVSSWAFDVNPLLEGLSPVASSLLRGHARLQDIAEGTVLWDTGDEVGDAFFPVSGMISIRVLTREGHTIEIATAGREGAAGLYDHAGRPPTLTQAIVAVSGRFVRVSALAFGVALRDSREIRHLAAVCDSWLHRQCQQTAACTASHAADRRFCRHLLRASDALATNLIPLTQEAIAQSLGIRRTTATLIAQDLQQRGIISYRRGKIVINDRAKLEAAACDCYAALGRRHWPAFILTGSRSMAKGLS
jgi:CRP-like cAMP-binding protein